MKLAKTTGSERVYTSFYTPITVASWKQLIPVLQQAGVRKSNSGAMYLTFAAYLANNNVIETDADTDRMVGLFSRQGFRRTHRPGRSKITYRWESGRRPW